MMTRNRSTPLFFQTALLVLTISLGLFAMTLTPYWKIYTDGVWHTQFRLDPLYPVRRSLMIFGLAACALSPCLLAYEIVKNKWRGNDVILHLSMVLLTCTIGWAAFPYWANGLFQAYIGRAPWADFDPQPLINSTWIGPGWAAGVLILMLISLAASPLLLLLALVFSIEQKSWRQGIAVVLCLGLTATFFVFSPNYWGWFFD